MKFRSEGTLKKTPENAAVRCCFKAMGYTDYELDSRPVIGIANSWNTIVPGHYNLKDVAEHVKKGIYSNGGTAVEFGVIAGCDGVADWDNGMNFVLPSREVICDSVELQVRMSHLDAVVLLGSCDKIVPGMLMAAARLNIPAILLNGGPMLGGAEFDGRQSDQTTPDEAVGMLASGKISEQEFMNLEETSVPGCGSCAYLGTANSMGCVAEALGMSLTGSALIPAVYAERLRAAFETGRAVCDLARKGIRPRDIITERSVRNAIKTVNAVSASTNTVLHLSAIAKEAGLDMDVVREFKNAGKETPHIAKVNPSSKWTMEDFYKAGGIPRVMTNLGDIIDTGVMTCSGKTLGENLASYRYLYPENRDIIRTPDAPFSEFGGIAVLEGNLAPDTAITKPGAYSEKLRYFKGRARVFDGEEAANKAILDGNIDPGDVIVIRYEGPKGGPGMREMYHAMKYLYGMGMGEVTALITDGRFSGTNNGCFVGHISPEAAEGGPIAAVRDGDEIEIDVNAGKISVNLSDEEIRNRLKDWTPPEKNIPDGYLKRYVRLVTSAGKGAVLE